ncbi:hypothetical protein [Streptomyces sp. NPDC051183]|uniref:hypothetical protein n=1 Tax=Streptomyces sp. NPDC051183 TaxID=3155165 RepID=UPI003421EAD6
MPVDSWTWDPIVVCSCGTGVLDNAGARQGHTDAWHSARYPAEFRVPAPAPARTHP